MINLLHTGFLLMAPQAGQGQETNPWMTPLMFAAIFVVFYFFMIRPQNKRRKEREAQMGRLEKGDKVVTSSGIHGTVSSVEDNTILVQVADNVKLRFEKSAIANVVQK